MLVNNKLIRLANLRKIRGSARFNIPKKATGDGFTEGQKLAFLFTIPQGSFACSPSSNRHKTPEMDRPVYTPLFIPVFNLFLPNDTGGVSGSGYLDDGV